jgi:hypothetical protein
MYVRTVIQTSNIQFIYFKDEILTTRLFDKKKILQIKNTNNSCRKNNILLEKVELP